MNNKDAFKLLYSAVCACTLFCTTASGDVTRTGDIGPQTHYYGIGNNTDGTVTIDGGSDLPFTENVILGASTGVMGSLTVSGAGSSFSTDAWLTAGYLGEGFITVRDEGSLEANDLSLSGYSGSYGEFTVTGSGSSVSIDRNFIVGDFGLGKLRVLDGAAFHSGNLVMGSSGTPSEGGSVLVSGAGSSLTAGGTSFLGFKGPAELTVNRGGAAEFSNFYLGYGSSNPVNATAHVSGQNSGLTVHNGLVIGGDRGSGRFSIADHAKVDARQMTIDPGSELFLQVSGDDMVEIGDGVTTGTLVNNGTVTFYGNAALPAGAYSPVRDAAGGGNVNWGGSGSVRTVGGTWDAGTQTFTVAAPVGGNLAGDVILIPSFQRVEITDSAGGESMGAGFGDVPGGHTFSSVLLGQQQMDDLDPMLDPGSGEELLAGWDFTTSLTGQEVLLTFDVGTERTDFNFWHLNGEGWSTYAPDFFAYEADGKLSFAVEEFSAYAVSGRFIPEPSPMLLLVLAFVAAQCRRSRRTRQAGL